MHPDVPRARQAALLLAYVLTRAWMVASSHYSDVPTWFHRLSHGGTLAEYGPLATLLARAPFWLGIPSQDAYVTTLRGIALAADLLLTSLVVRRTGWASAVAFVLGSGLLHALWLDRVDLYVALFLVLALGSSRPWLLGAALFKFPFIALAWVPVLRLRDRPSLRTAITTTATFVLVLAVGTLLFGPDTFLTPLGFHALRGLQRESLWGNFLDVGRVFLGWPCHVVSGSGSPELQCAGMPWLPWLGRATLGLGVLVTSVGLRDLPPARALLLAVVAYTAFNPVGSPQFAVVVLALAPLALDPRRREDRTVVGLLLLYAALTERAFARWGLPAFEALTLARNLSLLGVWTLLMVRRPPQD